jgi:hypothetical protein
VLYASSRGRHGPTHLIAQRTDASDERPHHECLALHRPPFHTRLQVLKILVRSLHAPVFPAALREIPLANDGLRHVALGVSRSSSSRGVSSASSSHRTLNAAPRGKSAARSSSPSSEDPVLRGS